MLDTVARVAGRVSLVGAGLCLVFMMLVVVADVALRAIDPAWRIFGMLDLVELSLDCLIYLAIPAALFQGKAITVDLVDAGARREPFILAGAVLTLVALLMLGSQIVRPALEILHWEERTLDLGLPKFWYWLPIWAGTVLAIVAATLALAAALRAMCRR